VRRARRTRRRFHAGLGLLLVAALVAGCGGSDGTKQFGKRFEPVNEQLLTLVSSVGQAVAARPSDKALAAEFNGFASRFLVIKARVDGLKPPDKLRSQTHALSAAVGHLAGDMRTIAAASGAHRPDLARAATVSLVRDSQAAGAARREIARKTGTKVNP